MNVDTIMNDLVKKHPGEVEYHQAVREVLESIEEVYNENPHFRSANIVEMNVSVSGSSSTTRIFFFSVSGDKRHLCAIDVDGTRTAASCDGIA